jgi:hypothetical protein
MDAGALHSYLESLNIYDNLDSVSVSESLETKSLESCDFEGINLHTNNRETEVKLGADPKGRRNGIPKKLMKLKKKCFPGQASNSTSNVLHSASADLGRFGLKRSGSSANLRATRSSSTTFFHNRVYVPTPNYDLTSTFFPGEDDKLNLDTRLKLRDRELIEVEPLTRWDKKPIFTTTTAGHKAWYERARDMIERRRWEIVNMESLEECAYDQDLDIIVSRL